MDSLSQKIRDRARHWKVELSPAQVDVLVAYLELLGRWNRRMNLTGLDVDPPDEWAIDRLVVEPAVAAGFIGGVSPLVIDVGSGAGSPAIPLKVVKPGIRLVMVEARARKAAFLRAAVRELGLPECAVEARRFGETTENKRLADAITLRAVRPDRFLVAAMRAALAPGGRLLCFGGLVESPKAMGFLESPDRLTLPGGSFVSCYEVAPT